jgi:tetratricopeptide (TPR) repeat protein
MRMKTHEMHDWLKAGTHYRSRGNYEKALEAFAQARLALLCEMAECLTSLGQLEDGRVLFEEVLEANPSDLRANAGMGIVFLLAGNFAAAATAFGNVLHLDPQNGKALCGLGLARKGENRLAEAFTLLNQSLERDADQKTALQAIAEVGLALGKADSVVPLLRKYAKRHPEDADIANDLQTLEASGPPAPPVDAITALRTALAAFRANPDKIDVVQELMTLLRQAGKEQEAAAVKTAFLQRNPGNESALLHF